MTDRTDLIIVGAGPAGMSAATAAAELGLAVVVFDQQAAPGGQIYRGLERLAAERPHRIAALGADYAEGAELVRAFRASDADFRPQSTVWQIDGSKVFARCPSGLVAIAAPSILIATGAVERATPFPGWTLPGVMTCGGAQILLKSASAVPEGRVVLAGSGPLLFMLAWQLHTVGVQVAKILETTSHRNYARTLVRSLSALRHQKYLRRGFSLLGDLRGAGIAIVGDVSDLQAHGDERVREISYRQRREPQRETCDWLLVHEGIAPNLNLWLSLRADVEWHSLQRSFQPRRGPWGGLSLPMVYAVGDCAHIGGAAAATFEGRLAALAIACEAGKLSADERDRRARALRRELRRERRSRAFLDRLYEPAAWVRVPREDATIICRCEEVAAGEVREAVALGCLGPNQLKAYTRCGMGPCQGRLCGLTVVETIAAARETSPADVGYYRIRAPVTPLTVGDIARSTEGDDVVVRP